MKQIIIVYFVSIALSVHGQISNEMVNNVIENEKTDKHLNIPGTRLFIIPPSNFGLATKFTGLQKDTNTLIKVFDPIGDNYFINVKDFTVENFEKSGADVIYFTEFTFNKFPAKFIYLQDKQSIKTYNILFGDATFSTMVCGICREKDTESNAQIKEAIFSVVYDKNLKIDPEILKAIEDSHKAIVNIDYPKSVYVQGGRYKWDTYFKETGGNLGYNLKAYDFYILALDGTRYTNSWTESVKVSPGGSASIYFWCDESDKWSGGTFHCIWKGVDENGNSIEIVQKVIFNK